MNTAFRNSPKIGGLQPFTTIDFPGKLASVVFLKGCNLRCLYCHNPDFMEASGFAHFSWEDIFSFLKRRQGFLEGIVFSGGEPTIHPEIQPIMAFIREMGLQIALHTNGCFPANLEMLLKERLLDFIALDIKAPFGEYSLVTEVGDGNPVALSTELVIKSGVAYEIRTTVHPELLSDEKILNIACSLKEMHADHFVLQQFRHGRIFSPSLSIPSGAFFKPGTLENLHGAFSHFEIRTA